MIKSRTDGLHSAPARIFSTSLSSIIPLRFFAGVAIFAGLFCFASPQVHAGAVAFNGTTYNQDFQSMTGTSAAGSGTNTVAGGQMYEISGLSGGGSVTGWYMYGAGWTTAAAKWVGSDPGSSTTGGFRQLIDTSGTVARAIGSQGSGTANGFYGVVLKNTSGSTITSLNISFDGVMNRNPSTTANPCTVKYRISSTDVVTASPSTADGTFNDLAGAWSTFSTDLSFTTPSSGTGAPGTAAAITPLFKITTKAVSSQTVSWPNNSFLYIRFSETDDSGADADLGVDNFTISVPSVATPTITGATTATAFTTTYGTDSAVQTFVVSGSNLTANLVATAPTGFEVSPDGTTWGGTATFTQSGGSASGSLRVRLKANAAVSGSYNAQNIVLSSTGATSVNIGTAAAGNAVSPLALTITANNQAVNAGSTLANVPASINFTSSGLANGETIGTVSLNYGGAGAVAGTFAIVPSGATGGTFTASNYIIGYVNGTLTVSSAPIPTIAYGGETLPALSTTYPSASSSTSFTIYGVNMAEGIIATAPIGFEVSTDNTTFASWVTVGASGTIGTTTVYVRVSGSTAAGSKSGSVALTSSGATTINVPLASSTVQAKPLIGSFTAANKAYDANASATVTARSLDGVVGSDAVTLSGGTAAFDTAGAGTGKTVILSGAVLSGIAASNYTLASVSTTTADITQADQTITFAALSPVSVGAAFTLSATASSGLAVTYVSSDSNVATVSGNTVTIVGPGTCSITASQVGDGNYKAATDVARSLVVNAPGSVGFDGNTYTQNFDSMTSGTANSVALSASTMTEVSSLTGGGSVNGWYIYATGWSTGPATSKWVAGDTGGSNAGGFREIIDSGASIGRALGSQGSGSAVGFFGVVLKNTSGRTIDKVDISYDAVMNRNPSTTANNYPMSYMVSSASISGTAGSTGPGTFNKSAGTWIDGVGFSTPTTGTGAPNATQAAITPLFRIGGASITQKLIGLNWPANGYLYIRWSETDEGGSDATAGVDNFTISAVSPAPTISSISPTSVLRGSGNTPVTFTGTGYISPETTVSIIGSALSLTNVSSNSLTANVTSNYFTTAGTLTMTLSNPAPGGGSVSTNLAVVTPRPTISGLSPASVVAGAGDTLLTISGTGFFGESVVRWNGTDLVTSYNSPNQLTTTIPAASLSNTAVASVTVATPDVGGLFQESVVSIFQVTSPTVPQVTPSVGTLSGFETPVGTPSAEKSYTLQGQYLSSNVLVTAPAQFQISKTSGSGFGSSLNLTAGEVWAGLTIYVRYNPSAASSSHLGSISHVSVGAVTQYVALAGNSQPTLSVNPTSVSIIDYKYVAGDKSGMNGDTPSFLVTGTLISTPVTINAPGNYGVSIDGVSFMPSLTLTPDGSGGITANILVQFQPLGAVSGNENIIVSSGELSGTVSANGRATGLVDNTLLSDQGGNSQVKLSWASSGYGLKVVVLARLGASISDVPSGVNSLTANSVYGQGSPVGSSFVVYKEDQVPFEGTASIKSIVSGLTNGQQYTFKVFVVTGDAVSSGTSVKSIPFANLSNVLTQWTFNSNPADALTTTGTLSPSTGTGTANAIGLITTASYVGGSATDPLGSAGAATGGDNSALVYTGPSSGTVADKSAGVQIAVSTVGKKDIVIYWDNRASNAGPKHLRAQYTLDVTAATPVWVDYVATTDGLNVANGGLYEAQAGDTWYIRRKADLTGVARVADNAKFGFRLVASYAPGESGYRKADGTSTSALAYFAGNFRTDMLTVTGVDVSQAQTPFESWVSGYNLSGASAAGTADPDNDGMDNNTEFAFGTSPVSGASRAVTQESVLGGIKIKWLQRSGINYTVKSTLNLGSAFSGPVSSTLVSPQPGGLGDYQQYEATLTGGDRGFLKVEATLP
jgi:YDG domain